jgi:hypothetical protein
VGVFPAVAPEGFYSKDFSQFQSFASSQRAERTAVPFNLPKKDDMAASVGTGSVTRSPGTLGAKRGDCRRGSRRWVSARWEMSAMQNRGRQHGEYG